MEDISYTRAKKHTKQQLTFWAVNPTSPYRKFLSIYWSRVHLRYRFKYLTDHPSRFELLRTNSTNDHDFFSENSGSKKKYFLASLVFRYFQKINFPNNVYTFVFFHQKGKKQGFFFNFSSMSQPFSPIPADTCLAVSKKIKSSKSRIIQLSGTVFQTFKLDSKLFGNSFTDERFQISFLFQKKDLFSFDLVEKKELTAISLKIFKTLKQNFPQFVQSDGSTNLEDLIQARGILGQSGTLIKSSETNNLISTYFHKKRLALMGSLLDTLKHELSNPLFGMSLAVETLRDSIELLSYKNDLANIHTQIQRCQKIIENFSRAYCQVGHQDSFDLVQFFEEVFVFAKSESFRVNKKIEVSNQSNGTQISTDRSLLSQIALNIILNCCQAFQDIHEKSLAPFIKIVISQNKEKKQYQILFSDNGMGISREMANNIFNPFFTTKKSGTGLGLSICKHLAHKLGGELQYVELHPEGLSGANFVLKLPLITQSKETVE